MTSEELIETYKKLSNQQLLDIIDNKFDYTELAVSIAFKELSQREITEKDIETYKTEKIQEVQTFISKNIIEDLSIFQKNLFYFLWIPLVNFPFKQNFRDDGEILKLKQANYYSLLGFIVFMIVGFLSSGLTVLTSLGFWVLGFIPVYAFDELFNRQAQIKKLNRIFGINEFPEKSQNTEEKDAS